MPCTDWCSYASSLIRSLTFGHETAAGVTYLRIAKENNGAQNRKGRKKDAALPFFHRLRLP